MLDIGIVNELIELPQNTAYIRCSKTETCYSDDPGADSNHPFPFYGQPELIGRLIAVAEFYRLEMVQTTQRLRITDMGLIKGGMFDLSHNWQIPHKGHRRGDSVDISRYAIRDDGQRPYVNQGVLDDVAIDFGLRRITETSGIECPAITEGQPPCIHLQL
jgi:hypothetical protein